jgi:elongation factor G
MHADRTEPSERAECGDIVAVTALKNVVTGDSLCDAAHPITFEPMHFPDPVVSVAVEAATSADRERLLEVVTRLIREDPTFTYRMDEDSGELILSGMGELHIEILQNRMRRQFNVAARFGRPRVTFRETLAGPGTGAGEFDKKIGDTRIIGRAAVEVVQRPRPAGELGWAHVETELAGRTGNLPALLQREARQIAESVCAAGGTNGYAMVDLKVRILEFSSNDPPDPLVPLRATLTLALRRAFAAAGTVLLEPVMRLEVRAPESSLGAVVRDLGSRRAEIRDTTFAGTTAVLLAHVPLRTMFGYSTDLRSLTQGQGSFTMEPFDYQPVQ